MASTSMCIPTLSAPAVHADGKRLYRDQLHLSHRQLDSLLESTSSALDLLSALSDSFKAVAAQTTAFQSQCEGLMADQKRVTKLADDITENLQYYTYLEPTTRRLNAPGAANFVRGEGFTEMLVNLDNCIDYMMTHVRHSPAAFLDHNLLTLCSPTIASPPHTDPDTVYSLLEP